MTYHRLPELFYESFTPPEDRAITTFTANAHDQFINLIGASADWTTNVFGSELRAFNHRTGVTFSVHGQPCSAGGKQGCSPSLLSGLREHLSPAYFLALQGPTGWGAWIGVEGQEPPIRLISGVVGAKRYGFTVREMISVTLGRDEDRALFSPEVLPPEPAAVPGQLFPV